MDYIFFQFQANFLVGEKNLPGSGLRFLAGSGFNEYGSETLEPTYHNVVPLVELEREVPVGLDPLGVGGIHHGLAGGSDGYGLRQLAVTRPRHPGHLPTGIAYNTNLIEQLAVKTIFI